MTLRDQNLHRAIGFDAQPLAEWAISQGQK